MYKFKGLKGKNKTLNMYNYLVVSVILLKCFPETSTDTNSDGTDSEDDDATGFFSAGPLIYQDH